MKATEILSSEHRVVERIVAVLSVAAERLETDERVRPGLFVDVASFNKGFTDGCHHRKEEGVLFKAMAANGMPIQGGPIGVMLYEHEQGRAFTKALREAAEKLQAGDDPQKQKSSPTRVVMPPCSPSISKKKITSFSRWQTASSRPSNTTQCSKVLRMSSMRRPGRVYTKNTWRWQKAWKRRFHELEYDPVFDLSLHRDHAVYRRDDLPGGCPPIQYIKPVLPAPGAQAALLGDAIFSLGDHPGFAGTPGGAVVAAQPDAMEWRSAAPVPARNNRAGAGHLGYGWADRSCSIAA